MQTDSVGQMYSASGLFHSQRRDRRRLRLDADYSGRPLSPLARPRGPRLRPARAGTTSVLAYVMTACMERLEAVMADRYRYLHHVCMLALESRTRLRSCVSNDNANLVYASYSGIVELRIVVDVRALNSFSHRDASQDIPEPTALERLDEEL